MLSHVQLCNPKDDSPQAPLSMEFSRQECWNGLPFPPPGNLSHPGMDPLGRIFTFRATGKPRGGVQAMCESCSVVSESLRPHGLYSAWNSPGQNTGVGSLSLLRGIFPTQGSNPGLPHCRQILYLPSLKGSPGVCKVQCNTLSPSWNRPPRGCGGERCHVCQTFS